MLFVTLALVYSLFFTCDAAYEDSLPKCSIKDNECFRQLFQKVKLDIGSTGLPELNVLPLDPMDIQNVSISIIDSVTFTVIDAVAKGMAKCVISKFSVEIEKRKGYVDFTCDLLSAKGNFTMSGKSPLIQSIIGGDDVNIGGKAKIKLNKLSVNLDFPFYPIKRDDNTYLYLETKKMKYTYDVENVHFVTENVVIGNNDISQFLTSYLNDNWKLVINTSGSAFLSTALDLFISRIQKVCDSVPTNKYIIEDMKQYI